jgi:hypothetical protein
MTFAAGSFVALVEAFFRICTDSALQRVTCAMEGVGGSIFLVLVLFAIAELGGKVFK